MNQLDLIHETVRDAVRSAIAALGGIKKVAGKLRPSWEADRAQKWLANALDEARPEKLEIEDVIWILREAKAIGFHAAMNYLAAECGYEAKAVEPEDELTKLLREYLGIKNREQALVPKIEEARIRVAK